MFIVIFGKRRLSQYRGPHTGIALKMAILIRQDLEMTKGKVAAQCCHGVLAAYKAALRSNAALLREWEAQGEPKITLKVRDEKEMLEIRDKARSQSLLISCIRDAGHTQVLPGSRTVLVIGPGIPSAT